MKALTAHIGSYPRIGEHKDQQRHRRGLAHFLNKDISAHAFRDVEQSVVHEVILEQSGCGLDEVTDGLIAWQDPISHQCGKIPGIKLTSLKRYFDTNFYYRLPVLSKPKGKIFPVTDEFRYAQTLVPKPVRAVLTGPLTLATHSEGDSKSFSKPAQRMKFFTELVADQVSDLAGHGAKVIQIDEPSLLQVPQEFPAVQKALQLFKSKSRSARLVLAVYFGSPLALLDKLLSLPIDSLNIDLDKETKPIFEKLNKSSSKMIIGFGCVNSRATKLEPIDPILNLLKTWRDQTKSPQYYLTPTTGLEYLPRDHAYAKLKLLVKIREELDK